MTIGSLFSGIGGLELGLQMCGLGPVLWQAEINAYARAVLARHWPGVTQYEDVRQVDERAAAVDVVCGGFPCQDLSFAGTGAGLAGARSGLWAEFARVVRVLRPRVVFLENVPALAIRGLDRVLAELAVCGFDAEWDCFRAYQVGAPHRRERLFVLAYADARGLEGVGGAQPGGEQGAQGDVVVGPGADGQFPPGPDGIENWSGPQPAVRRDADGLSRRLDSLRCLGNAVVPQQAALAFRQLSARACT